MSRGLKSVKRRPFSRLWARFLSAQSQRFLFSQNAISTRLIIWRVKTANGRYLTFRDDYKPLRFYGMKRRYISGYSEEDSSHIKNIARQVQLTDRYISLVRNFRRFTSYLVNRSINTWNAEQWSWSVPTFPIITSHSHVCIHKA